MKALIILRLKERKFPAIKRNLQSRKLEQKMTGDGFCQLFGEASFFILEMTL